MATLTKSQMLDKLGNEIGATLNQLEAEREIDPFQTLTPEELFLLGGAIDYYVDMSE